MDVQKYTFIIIPSAVYTFDRAWGTQTPRKTVDMNRYGPRISADGTQVGPIGSGDRRQN
jgi:hypothetical protein